MPLRELDLIDGERDKVAIAIARLREFEPPEGYALGDSGGKDSVVVRELAKRAGVKHENFHALTTIDPPPLIYFLREHHPDTQILHPEAPLLSELVRRGFPTRMRRWCCGMYKERPLGGYKLTITGIRSGESARRSVYGVVSTCFRYDGRLLNPIVDWSGTDVWAFIRENNLPYCRLYDEGWSRIGCVGCPMASSSVRAWEFQQYPGYERAFRRAFRRLHERLVRQKRPSGSRWKDGDEMFDVWLHGEQGEKDNGTGSLFD